MVLIPSIVLAQTVTIINPLGNRDLEAVLRAIIAWIYWIALIGIAPIMYIIAGYMFITAAGDPQKVDTAKKMVLWVSIGLAIATAAYGIIAIIREILGVA